MTSPRRPRFSTSSRNTMRIAGSGGPPAPSIRREGYEGQGARPLDGLHQLPLVPGAGARDAPRKDLGALRRKGLQQPHVFVVDERYFLVTEFAEFLLAEEELLLERLLAAASLAAAAAPATRRVSHDPRLSSSCSVSDRQPRVGRNFLPVHRSRFHDRRGSQL